jgi:hypothetical protein
MKGSEFGKGLDRVPRRPSRESISAFGLQRGLSLDILKRSTLASKAITCKLDRFLPDRV